MRPRNIHKEEAIRRLAMKIIADEGLENLTIQKVAEAAQVSARTIYIKYKDKEDMLIRLFLDEVLGAYEKATLDGFDPGLKFAEGIKKIWTNAFAFFIANRPAFALLQYGKSSPLLNKAFHERNIQQGSYFAPIHEFLQRHVKAGTIVPLPFDAYRALLFAPLIDLIAEYFDYQGREEQIVTPELLDTCCTIVIKGFINNKYGSRKK